MLGNDLAKKKKHACEGTSSSFYLYSHLHINKENDL